MPLRLSSRSLQLLPLHLHHCPTLYRYYCLRHQPTQTTNVGLQEVAANNGIADTPCVDCAPSGYLPSNVYTVGASTITLRPPSLTECTPDILDIQKTRPVQVNSSAGRRPFHSSQGSRRVTGSRTSRTRATSSLYLKFIMIQILTLLDQGPLRNVLEPFSGGPLPLEFFSGPLPLEFFSDPFRYVQPCS